MGANTTRLTGALLMVSTAIGAVATPGEEAAVPAAGADGWDALLPAADELMARHDCLACHAPDSDLRATLDPRGAPRVDDAVG
ncbi:MAG: hypothetical protein VXZ39_05630, partial [Planctomycetota bacterium]|nr:hypothetical protein [Planctomycetota bacterium]